MITDRLFTHITTHTIRTAFLAFTMSMLMAGVAYGGDTMGTFEANAPRTVTASMTGEHEVGAEQYKLTVTKDSNVSSVTVKVGSATISPVTSGGNTYWIDKGSTAKVSATAKSGYKITSNTNNVNINAAKTINITSAAKPTLSLTSVTGGLKKLRVYSSSSTYTDYTSYTNVPVYEGQKVVFYHDNSKGWSYRDLSSNIGALIDLGTGPACRLIVPVSATGPATLSMYVNTQTSGYSQLDFSWTSSSSSDPGTSGWVRSSACYPVLGS